MRQIVSRLTPLADVRAMIEAEVGPVATEERAIADAVGYVLAEDVSVLARPERAIALQDGWALRAEETQGASAYAPAFLSRAPEETEAGQPMPDDSDCVAPFEDVRIVGGQAEVLASFAPGDGVLPAGGDHDGRAPLMLAGRRPRGAQAAGFTALGIAKLYIRAPRVLIAPVKTNDILSAAAEFINCDVSRRGGSAECGIGLDQALAATSTDLIVIIGGTGSGANDRSAAALAAKGRLAMHGIALSPGETSGLGFISKRPVLLLPGRVDAAIAGWLMLGRVLLDRLSGARGDDEHAETLTLARKITSTVGLLEVVPVRCADGQAEPLATRYWPFSALARADGYVVIPPESEGSSAGSAVRVWPLP
jgi:molybdopterin biosynthesis enzyme